MNLRTLTSLCLAALLPILTACSSFSPVYGDAKSPAVLSFNFTPPSNRLEQIIINELSLVFPATPDEASPTLNVSAATANTSAPMTAAVIVGRIVQTRVVATVTIAQGGSLFTVTRFADAGYKAGDLVPVDLASATGSEETAARATAEALRAAILSTYRP
jgi:hypothetical protein